MRSSPWQDRRIALPSGSTEATCIHAFSLAHSLDPIPAGALTLFACPGSVYRQFPQNNNAKRNNPRQQNGELTAIGMTQGPRGNKLTIDGQVDTSTVASIVGDVLGQLPAQADTEIRVLALYHWVREALFIYPSCPDDLCEDFNKALRQINWWGYGLCGTQSKVFGMLVAHALGRENVRLLGTHERETGNWKMRERGYRVFKWSGLARDNEPDSPDGHSTLEIFWDGAWHLLDVMVGFYRRHPDGTIASLQDLLDDVDLAAQPVGDPEGDMPFGDEREVFTATTVSFRSVTFNSWPGEGLPLLLRPGESFTWLAEPIAGAYYLHPKIRERFGDEALEPGPRGHRPDRATRRYGNGEHRWVTTLHPRAEDPFWCTETGDWHLTVELPYPIITIEWRMEEGANGFLLPHAEHDDRLLPIQATGQQTTPKEQPPSRRYRLILRSPGRATETGPKPLVVELKSIVQLNPQVVPRLLPGHNRIQLRGSAGDDLQARFRYRIGDGWQENDCIGVGPHDVAIDGDPESQQLTDRKSVV